MKDAIGYLGVSIMEQDRSGLGLAARRYDNDTFEAREGFSIKSWYQNIQTGVGRDAPLRPGFAPALEEARPPVAKRAPARSDHTSARPPRAFAPLQQA
jgi:DNA invertase Pin-like site-specific DNA recombinase